MRAARYPLVVGLERQSKPLVGDAHIAVDVHRYRFRHDRPHLLRHHADIGGVAAVVDEAIVAEAVVEAPEQHDLVLDAHIGATRAAASSTAAAPAAAEAATAAPAAEAATATPAAEAAPSAPAATKAPPEPASHSAAAHCTAVGEGRVGSAHSHSAHRRASRPADARPRRGTAGGPRGRTGA